MHAFRLFNPLRRSLPRRRPQSHLCLALVLVSTFLASCSTPSPTQSRSPFASPIDLSQAGWSVRSGQLVWHSPRTPSGLVAEFQFAAHTNGRAWLQFSKAGLPLLSLQTSATHWQLASPQRNRPLTRPLPLPSKLGPAHLMRCLQDLPPTPDWTWNISPDGHWSLSHASGRERFQGFTSP